MKSLKTVYNVLYYFLLAFAMVVVRIVVPIRVIGKKNLPKDRGYVLAPNHVRAIDPLYIMLARGFAKKMIIMGKEELFNINFLLDFFWKIVGVFPVDRGAGNRSTIDSAITEVQKGRGLLLFPEGTRTKDGSIAKLKSGAFVVAMQTAVDMIPCYIWYKAGHPKIFRRTTVVFGAPVSMAELGLDGEYSPSKLRHAKTVFTQKMQELHDDNVHKL